MRKMNDIYEFLFFYLFVEHVHQTVELALHLCHALAATRVTPCPMVLAPVCLFLAYFYMLLFLNL